jgi:hypothetical protein
MSAIFGPIADIIALKRKDEGEALRAAAHYMEWCRSTEGQGHSELERGAKMRELLGTSMNKFRAFETVAETPEDKHLMHNAADYTDRWFQTDHIRFCCYYICGTKWDKGTKWEKHCGMCIRTDCWKQRFEDPLAAQQRWYCKNCNTRYAVKFGMLLEICTKELNGVWVARYARADYPKKEIQDIKAMAVERAVAMKGDTYSSAAELLRLLPKAEPLAEGLFTRRVDIGEGVYQAVGFTWGDLPGFEWNGIFSLLDDEMEAGVGSCDADIVIDDNIVET